MLANAVAPAPPRSLRVLAVNTDLHAWDGVLEGDVEVPLASAEPGRLIDLALLERPVAFFGTDAQPASLTDSDGHAVPFQVLGQEDHVAHFMSRYEPPLAVHVRRFRLAFRASVPGFGFATMDLGFEPSESASLGAGAGARAGVTDGRAWLETDDWRIEVNEDGTLDLRDRRSGLVWPRAGVMLDEGDVGDEYNYAPPAVDTAVTHPSAVSATVELAGPLVAAVRIDLTLRVPESASGDRRSRSAALVDLHLTLRVAMTAGSPRIDFELALTNTARDHRVRVLFPTGAERVEFARADSAFAVVTRPARREVPPELQVEAPVSAAPLHSFVDAGDGARGITVLADGLNEYEVTAGPGPSVALTLLRSVGWLSREDLSTRRGTPGPRWPRRVPSAPVPSASASR